MTEFAADRFYSRDLIAGGIPDAATFVAILDARSDRLSRAAKKHLEKRLTQRTQSSQRITGEDVS